MQLFSPICPLLPGTFFQWCPSCRDPREKILTYTPYTAYFRKRDQFSAETLSNLFAGLMAFLLKLISFPTVPFFFIRVNCLRHNQRKCLYSFLLAHYLPAPFIPFSLITTHNTGRSLSFLAKGIQKLSDDHVRYILVISLLGSSLVRCTIFMMTHIHIYNKCLVLKKIKWTVNY